MKLLLFEREGINEFGYGVHPELRRLASSHHGSGSRHSSQVIGRRNRDKAIYTATFLVIDSFEATAP